MIRTARGNTGVTKNLTSVSLLKKLPDIRGGRNERSAERDELEALDFVEMASIVRDERDVQIYGCGCNPSIGDVDRAPRQEGLMAYGSPRLAERLVGVTIAEILKEFSEPLSLHGSP